MAAIFLVHSFELYRLHSAATQYSGNSGQMLNISTDYPRTPTDFHRTSTDSPRTPIDFPGMPIDFTRIPTDYPRTPTNLSTTLTNFPGTPTDFSKSPTDFSTTLKDVPSVSYAELPLQRALYPVVYPDHLKYENIQLRIPDRVNKPLDTTSHMVKVVATLERWLWAAFQETRPIEDIPPAELDQYLAQYYQILRAPDGSEYRVSTFNVLRSYLERFLRENSYPLSITKSKEFTKSIEVHADKRKRLWIKQNQQFA